MWVLLMTKIIWKLIVMTFAFYLMRHWNLPERTGFATFNISKTATSGTKIRFINKFESEAGKYIGVANAKTPDWMTLSEWRTFETRSDATAAIYNRCKMVKRWIFHFGRLQNFQEAKKFQLLQKKAKEREPRPMSISILNQ